MYVSDAGTIRRIDLSTNKVRTIAGTMDPSTIVTLRKAEIANRIATWPMELLRMDPAVIHPDHTSQAMLYYRHRMVWHLSLCVIVCGSLIRPGTYCDE